MRINLNMCTVLVMKGGETSTIDLEIYGKLVEMMTLVVRELWYLNGGLKRT